jgi:hypothetical protein
LQGFFIEVSKVDHGHNPFRGELNNGCMCNPHLVSVLEESCRLCSYQDHGVGMVAFVVDGYDKLLKYLPHVTFLVLVVISISTSTLREDSIGKHTH